MAIEFESLAGLTFKQATLDLPNPLDKRITSSIPAITMVQPEGEETTGDPRKVRYDIVIPPEVVKKLTNEMAKPAGSRKKIPVRVSVFWGAGGDNISIYGLKFFFSKTNDTILVAVEGFEDRGTNGKDPKNVGFHKLYLAKLIAELKRTDSTIDFDLLDTRIAILSGYSTGYGGLGQSVNNDFFALQHVERVIFFDCIYRADKPVLPGGEKPPPLLTEENNNGPDEVDAGHANSAFNSRRAIIKIQKAQEANIDNSKKELETIKKEQEKATELPAGPDRDKKIKELKEKFDTKTADIATLQSKKLKVIGYAVSMAGSPKYKNVARGQYAYTLFVPILLDLRDDFLRKALFVLSLTRTLDAAKRASIITEADIPDSYRQFIPGLPKRGEICSGDATRTGSTQTLKEWGKDKERNIAFNKAAGMDVTKAVGIVSSKKLFYPTGYPDVTNTGGMLHIGHLLEFGGEFLV